MGAHKIDLGDRDILASVDRISFIQRRADGTVNVMIDGTLITVVDDFDDMVAALAKNANERPEWFGLEMAPRKERGQ